MIANDAVKIAKNHNNISQTRNFSKLNPPLFHGYTNVSFEYIPPKQRRNADGRFSGHGRASAVLIFEYLSNCEMEYIMSHFFSDGTDNSCDVTIKLRPLEIKNWWYYNGIMKKPIIGTDAEIASGGFSNVRLEIFDLVKI